jgi:hypothetical protein
LHMGEIPLLFTAPWPIRPLFRLRKNHTTI